MYRIQYYSPLDSYYDMITNYHKTINYEELRKKLLNLYNVDFKENTNMYSTNRAHVIKETEKDYKLFIGVPGLKKEDIDITVDNSKLSIVVKKENVLNVSIDSTFDLTDIKLNEIEAKVEDGLLTVTFPKEKTTYKILVS